MFHKIAKNFLFSINPTRNRQTSEASYLKNSITTLTAPGALLLLFYVLQTLILPRKINVPSLRKSQSFSTHFFSIYSSFTRV
jgi:hypothetical protein